MINILLSTFQSENYIEEQINSIINQSYSDWKLIIRDDGSSDNTIKIINSFLSQYPEKIYFLVNSKENLGTVKSFEYLLNNSDSDYFMFCDHDDIWLEEKIQSTIDKMNYLEKTYKNTPLLIHTDLCIVNMKLEVKEVSMWKSNKINPLILKNFNYLGVCNAITGCTVMINKFAKEICLPFPENTIMHDLWIGLCVSKYGIIDFVDKPTILYRQHNQNQIGATKFNSLSSYLYNKVLDLQKTFENNKKQYSLLQNLQYGGVLKYLKYKILYFLKARTK